MSGPPVGASAQGQPFRSAAASHQCECNKVPAMTRNAQPGPRSQYGPQQAPHIIQHQVPGPHTPCVQVHHGHADRTYYSPDSSLPEAERKSLLTFALEPA
jgi:hypothetical protein